MNRLKEHILFKFFTILLATLLLMPTGYKFVHIFAHHKHDICKGEKFTHLHEINTECDFYKFKLSSSYTFCIINIELISLKADTLQIISQYHFLSEFQRLQASLRGPPSLV